jgi:hypothetical protein
LYLNIIRKISPILLLILAFGCSGNRDQSDEINQLLENLQNIDLDDLDDAPANRTVHVYTDSARVELFKNEFYPAYEHSLNNYLEERSVVEKFVAGEPDAKEELLEILYHGEEAVKRTAFAQLNFYNQSPVRITDNEVLNAIKDNLYHEIWESYVIDLLVYHDVPNYQDILKQRLFHGAYEPGKILQTLAPFKLQDVLDNMTRKMCRNLVKPDDLYDSFLGLEQYRLLGSKDQQQQVLETCFYILKKDFISPALFEEAKEQDSYENPAAELMRIIFNHAAANPDWVVSSAHKTEIHELAKNHEFSELLSTEATAVLIILEGKKYRRNVIEKLKFTDSFSDGTFLAGVYYKKEKDERILRSVLSNYEKLYGDEIYLNIPASDALFDLLEGIDTVETEQMIRKYIQGSSQQSDLLKLFEIYQQTFEEMAQYLFEKGISDVVLNESDVVELDWSMGRMYNLLNESGSYFWIPSEDYEVIPHQHLFLRNYQENGHGVLDSALIFVEQDTTIENNDVIFKAIYQQTGYEMNVGEKESYDYSLREDLQYFINFILEDNQIEERFLDADSDSYIFTTPFLRRQLMEDYALVW